MKKLTQILMMLLVLSVGTGITSCDEIEAIIDNPVVPEPTPTPTPQPEPQPAPVPTYASDLERPLTFEACQNNVSVTFKFTPDAKPDYRKVAYSLDQGATWTALSGPEQAILLKRVGDMVMFRGDNPTYNGDAKFVVTKATVGTRSLTRGPNETFAYVYGNLLSLLKGSDFSNLKELTAANEGAFRKLFEGCPIDVVSEDGQELKLPAEKLSEGCFASMFAGCTGITVGPTLTASTLVKGSYTEMFAGCSNLSRVTMLATEVEDGARLEECVAGWLNDAGTVDGLTLTVSDNTTIPTVDLTDGNDKVTIVNQSGDILPTGIWIKMGDKVLDKGDEIVMEVNQEIELTAVLKPAGTEGDVEWRAEAFYLMVINGKVTAMRAGSTSIQVVCEVGNSTLTTSINVTIKEATIPEPEEDPNSTLTKPDNFESVTSPF